MAGKPKSPPAGTIPGELVDELLEQLLQRIGDANIPPGAIGHGKMEHLGKPKGLNQQWVKVNLTGLDLDNVDVPHTLGAVPEYCALWETENTTTPATFLQARPVEKDKWTVSNCRVAINVNAVGSATDCIATFQVGGE